MKKIISTLLIISFLLVFAKSAFAGDVWVKGYYRSNGTYVQPHYRTRPDNSIWNNYSTKGNVNPYTGKKGYKDPFKLPNTYKLPSIKRGYGYSGCENDLFGW